MYLNIIFKYTYLHNLHIEEESRHIQNTCRLNWIEMVIVFTLTCLKAAHRGSPFSASDCAARSLHFASLPLMPVAVFHHEVVPGATHTVHNRWSSTPPDWAGLHDHGSSFFHAAGINHLAGTAICLMLPSKRVFVFFCQRAASCTEPQHPWRRYLWSY